MFSSSAFLATINSKSLVYAYRYVFVHLNPFHCILFVYLVCQVSIILNAVEISVKIPRSQRCYSELMLLF